MTRPINPNLAARRINEAIGAKLRVLRVQRGISQTELGHAAGVTFQQIQKYERGDNRVSAGALAVICTKLAVPIGSLFDDLDQVPAEPADRLALEMNRIFAELPDGRRRFVLKIARELAIDRSVSEAAE